MVVVWSEDQKAGGRKESLLTGSSTPLRTGESLVHSVGLEECFCLFRVKLFIFIHMHRDGEDPNTNTSASALLWVEVEAHLHVAAGAGSLPDHYY
jgi:hypothetical protein